MSTNHDLVYTVGLSCNFPFRFLGVVKTVIFFAASSVVYTFSKLAISPLNSLCHLISTFGSKCINRRHLDFLICCHFGVVFNVDIFGSRYDIDSTVDLYHIQEATPAVTSLIVSNSTEGEHR